MYRKPIMALSLAMCACCLQNNASAQSLDTPMTRLRPIGSPSAVDQYRPPTRTSNTGRSQVPVSTLRETAYQAPGNRTETVYQPVRQAVMMQGFEAPTLPNSGMVDPNMGNPGVNGGMGLPPGNAQPGAVAPGTGGFAPPSSIPPNNGVSPNNGMIPNNGIAPNNTAIPRSALPSANPMSPVPMDSGSIVSSGDLAPIPAPQMGGGFATIDNCNCVSGPSSYVAASTTVGCTPVGYQGPVTYQPVSQVTTPPGVVVPAVYPPSSPGIPRGPLISFGQELNPVQVGQGIVGQPVAYVPGQRFRNWIRYFFP